MSRLGQQKHLTLPVTFLCVSHTDNSLFIIRQLKTQYPIIPTLIYSPSLNFSIWKWFLLFLQPLYVMWLYCTYFTSLNMTVCCGFNLHFLQVSLFQWFIHGSDDVACNEQLRLFHMNMGACCWIESTSYPVSLMLVKPGDTRRARQSWPCIVAQAPGPAQVSFQV